MQLGRTSGLVGLLLMIGVMAPGIATAGPSAGASSPAATSPPATTSAAGGHATVAGSGSGSDLAFIVNPGNATEGLSLPELRALFKEERGTWPNGQKVTVVLMDPGHVERAAVLKAVYRMSEGEFNRFFLQAVFSGRVQTPPRTLPSAQAVQHLVAIVPGAIGCVRAKDAVPAVRVLHIDGRTPGEAAYAFRLAMSDTGQGASQK